MSINRGTKANRTLTFPSKSLVKSLSSHASEHYPSSSTGVYPTSNDSAIALLIVANKYSLNNFWYMQPCIISHSQTSPLT